MATATTTALDEFTPSYIATALWSSTDDDGEPLDGLYDVDDLAPETLARMVEDCRDFQRANGDDINDDLGRRLTDMSHPYGTVDLYVGDDGLIHA